MHLMHVMNRYFEITLQLVKKDLKAKYKNTLLGYVWSVCNPLMMAYILNIAFSGVIGVPTKDYILFILTALFAWSWFNVGVVGSSGCFIYNASIIKKVNLPRFLIPLSTTLTEGFHFLLSLPIILFFLWLHDFPIYHSSWIKGLPLLLIATEAITYGLALMVSSINTIFRDMERIVGLLLTMLFYLTPILYPSRTVPGSYRVFFDLNPMANLINMWRGLFMEGTFNWEQFQSVVIFSMVCLCIGSFSYKVLNKRFAEVL